MKKKKKTWNEIHLTNIKYHTFKRTNYIITHIDTSNKLYILGYNFKKNEGFINQQDFLWYINHANKPIEKAIENKYYNEYISDSENILYKGWSVFDSMISLRQDLHYEFCNEDSISDEDLITLENSLSNEDKKKIIKWVRQYGMPFVGDKLNENHAFVGILPHSYGFKNDITTCIEYNACICRLGTFLIGLNIIYKTFGYYLTYLLSTVNNDVFPNLDITTSYPRHSRKDSLAYVKRALNSISFQYFINIEDIDTSNKQPNFKFYTETLISLAMYQLSILITSKRIYFVAECSRETCKSLYIPTRATKIYCMNCSRQKKYSEKLTEKIKKD